MKFLKLYFSFTGRLSLKKFWLYWNIPVYSIGALISYLLLDVFHYPNALNAIAVLLTWPLLATSAKRLHDLNLSAWWLLLHLIPVLGSFILFIQIYLIPGTDRENRFDHGYKERHPEEFQNKYHPLVKVGSILIAFQFFCFLTNKSILGVIYTDGPYYGRVLDAETGKPIASAAVAGVWEFEHGVLFQTMRSFADAKDTVTDQNGNFYLERNWAFTLWINTAKLKISDLYVFKSGYDSHPPMMDWRWTKEDEERRNITTGAYQRKYKKRCEPEKECIIELNSPVTTSERAYAIRGARIGIDEVPVKNRKNISNFIYSVNVERKMLNDKKSELKNGL